MKNKFVVALASIVFALLLWTYVITVVNPESEETYHNIPVIFEGEALMAERNLMVVDGLQQSITMTLSGNRSDLNNLKSSDITIKVDLSKVSEAGDLRLSYTYSFPGNIAANALEALHRPDHIEVTVERRLTKELDINVVFEGKVADDYIAYKDGMELSQSRITVTGPESVVSRIAEARLKVDLNGRSESFSEELRYQLLDAQGQPVDSAMVVTNAGEITLRMSIFRIKEVPLVLTFVAGGGATEETCKVTINPQTIQIAGGEAALEGLNEINLGTVELAEITSITELTFPIVLPANVTNLTGVTEAKVNLQFPMLSKKTFTVTNFVALNVPQELEAEILTQQMEITVRGRVSLVAKMTGDDITVYVDFAGEQIGSFTTAAQIVMAGEFAEVGAIGDYSVSATLREPQEALNETEGTDTES